MWATSEEPDEMGDVPMASQREHLKGYRAVAGGGILTHTITNERLARAGYYSILNQYESLHLGD